MKTLVTISEHPRPLGGSPGKRDWWDKEAWEAQWEGTLSKEVALHLRRRRSDSSRRLTSLSSLSTAARPPTYQDSLDSSDGEKGLVSPPCSSAFDPLHLPSLVVFSFSLLRAAGTRLGRAIGLTSRDGASRRRSSTITNATVKREEQAPMKPSPGRGVG